MKNNFLEKLKFFQLAIFFLLSIYSLFLFFINSFAIKYILYFVIFFILFFINLLFIYLREKLKVFYEYYTIAIITSLFTFYLIEGYLIFNNYNLDPKIRNSKLAKDEGKTFDLRTKYEVYKNDIEQKVDSVPSLHPTNWTKQNGFSLGNKNIFPLSGISKKLTIYCNENGYFLKYMSDRYGFNNDDKLWDKQDKNIVIGDSFGHGACVHNKFNIPTTLSRKLNSNFINLANGGNGPLTELASLIEFIDLIKPEIVVWLYFEKNDIFQDLEKEILSPILLSYLNDGFSQDIIYKQSKINDLLTKHIPDIEKQYLDKTNKSNLNKILDFAKLSITRNTVLKLVLNENEIFKKNIDKNKKSLFFQIISKAQRISKNNNSKFFVVYVPSVARYMKEYDEIEHNQIFYRKKIIDEFNQRKFKLIDLHEYIINNFDNPLELYPYNYWGHFNEIGYSQISNYIADEINKNL